ncbi:MAG: DUF4258 domain-containing protein [Clostridia bacterium]|nr:DUF4258 domain-containing protein [Clostridia bacterium]
MTDLSSILEAISDRFKRGEIDWSYHARERFRTREINRWWVKGQIADKRFILVEFIWRYGLPTHLTLSVGKPLPNRPPVHVRIEHTEEKTRVVTVYWVDYNKFENDGLTRKREG